MKDLNCFNIKNGYYKIDDKGNIFSNQTNKIMKPKISKDGYYTIGLRTNDNVKKFFRVHRLVAAMFIDNPLNKDIVNHIDGNKLNNNVENLEWCTLSENQLHSIHTLGNIPMVTNEKKISCENIITGEITIYPSISKCARQLNCTQANISAKLCGVNSNPAKIGKMKNLLFKYI